MKQEMSVCYDTQPCLKCFACSISCGVENRVRLLKDKNMPIENSVEKSMGYLNHICPKIMEKGTYPNPIQITSLKHCNHCSNPQCMSVCPTAAISKKASGAVVINQDACVGCQACKSACPYDIPVFSKEMGRTYKCHMCSDRLEAGLPTACSAACPSVAIFSGKKDEVLAEATKRAEHYSKTLGKTFIVYGATEINSAVGSLSYLTIAPAEYNEEFLLPQNPSSLNTIADVAGKVFVASVAGAAIAMAAHTVHWNKNKHTSELYHKEENE